MRNKKLRLVLMALSFSILLGSLAYLIPDYRELWLFLQIIILPSIYSIGYELLMEQQRVRFQSEIAVIVERSNKLDHANQELRSKLKIEKIK